jgi:hypothetical protein
VDRRFSADREQSEIQNSRNGGREHPVPDRPSARTLAGPPTSRHGALGANHVPGPSDLVPPCLHTARTSCCTIPRYFRAFDRIPIRLAAAPLLPRYDRAGAILSSLYYMNIYCCNSPGSGRHPPQTRTLSSCPRGTRSPTPLRSGGAAPAPARCRLHDARTTGSPPSSRSRQDARPLESDSDCSPITACHIAWVHAVSPSQYPCVRSTSCRCSPAPPPADCGVPIKNRPGATHRRRDSTPPTSKSK